MHHTDPKDRVYRPSHEWAKVTDGVATVGITQHAQEALGDIVFADLPAVGTDAVSGETAATVESVKAAADIYAPVSGEVVAVNEQLEGAPELINSDPHDDGWMFQIRLADPADKLDGTMDAAEYEATILEDA